MAKPGSRRARELARAGANGARAKDLSGMRMSDVQAQATQEKIELVRGVRCFGCGRRITMGFRFTSIDPRDPADPTLQVSACTRSDCDFASEAKNGATYVEPFEVAWVDENGPDAPAMKIERRGGIPQPAAD